jgi:hypothetical protein
VASLLTRAVSAAALGATLTLASGCGPCPQVAAHRDAFLAREPSLGRQPHLSVLIPRKRLDEAIASGLRGIAPKTVSLPGLGELARHVSPIALTPRRIALEQAGEGQHQLAMEIGVELANRTLFTMTLSAQTRPALDATAGTVVLVFPADMLQSIRPNLPPEAVSKLAEGLLTQVPAVARSLIPRAEVNRLAQGAVDWLADNAVRLLRDEVLKPMGDLARVHLSLPDLPLAHLELLSVPGAFVVNARTSLPVELGLAPLDRAEVQRRGREAGDEGRVEIRIAAGVVVELANWAMARGDLPGRFDVQGKPSDGGAFAAGLQWLTGERPLKINIWSAEGVCLRARVGAQPRLAYSDGRLDLGVQGARVEEVDGPPLVSQAASWAQALWQDSVETSRARLGKTQVAMAQERPAGLGVLSVRLEGEALVFSLGAPRGRAASNAPRPTPGGAPRGRIDASSGPCR